MVAPTEGIEVRKDASVPVYARDEDLEDFFENGSLPLHIVDARGVIVRANRAELEMMGYARDEYVGQPVQRFHADPPVIADILARLTRGETIRNRPARLVAKDGSVRHVLIDSSGHFRGGSFHHTRCFTRDVTKLRESEEALDAARRQLAATEKLAALGTLVSGVAHEIRTPLTIIQTHLHVLRGRAEEAVRTGDYARLAQVVPAATREVESAIERAETLVRTLRRLTRSETRATRQPIDPVVREAVDIFASVNRARAKVAADLQPTPPALVDRIRLQQVVLNLLDNSAAATRDEDGPIVVRTYAEGDDVCLQVRDHGEGMTPDVLARIYEPLFTTRPDGTGLGMAIVQRIVHEHGGSIGCDSRPGEGTTFTVRFPRAP